MRGHSRLLVKEEDVRASFEESVCGRETGETAANNDDLGHSDMQDVCVGDEGLVGRRWWWLESKRVLGRRCVL